MPFLIVQYAEYEISSTSYLGGLIEVWDASVIVILQKNHLGNVEISGQQQKSLFKISYSRQEAEAKRLTTTYYHTSWKSINPKIQQVLTDMKFRGDLLPRSTSAGQKALKAAVKANSVQQVEKVS